MKYIFIIGGLFLAWLLFWQLPVNGLHYTTGEGKQVGYISAVENEGIFWKTGRAYLKPTMESTQEDVYCVMDKELLAKLEEVSRNNTKIEIKNVDYIAFGAKNCAGEISAISSFELIK
jgi:hypothetical protein